MTDAQWLYFILGFLSSVIGFCLLIANYGEGE
jgi:UPF0716 family protein affecting phage T7 exclusion